MYKNVQYASCKYMYVSLKGSSGQIRSVPLFFGKDQKESSSLYLVCQLFNFDLEF